jgi:hypothetical protein
MTDGELEGIAAQALNMAKRDIEQQRDFSFLLASCHKGEGLHRMTRVEALITEKLGDDWLNHGGKKDAGFLIMQIATSLRPPDAMVFVTAANMFKPTEKFNQAPPDQQKEIMTSGHDRHHQAAREGYLQIIDSLIAIAQTAERVCNYVLARASDAKPEVRFFAQEDLGGRMKMYGLDAQELMAKLPHPKTDRR